MKALQEPEMEPVTTESDSSTEETPGLLYATTHQTPWWIVSVMLHALVIVLAGLMTMKMDFDTGEVVIMETTIFEQPAAKQIETPKMDDQIKKLATIDIKTPTTNEKVDAELLMTEAFKAMAEIGPPSTENENPEDPNGIFGRPENLVRLTAAGSMEESGGGGTSGLTLADSSVGVGAASLGEGGGWGTGVGKGSGPGRGDGNGEWGNGRRGPKLRRHRNTGITDASEGSVEAALKWLAYHQETDGHWDAKRYGASVKTDTAITGLALLAFLGAGHSEKVGVYRSNVTRAVSWLKSKQDADGMLWDTTDEGGHRAKGYPCAIATLALVEAGGMGNVPDTRKAAQKAVDYVCNIHQFGDGYDKRGWRYGAKSEGDTSVTGWFIMALKSAKVCGFQVPEASLVGAIKFLDSVETKEEPLAGIYGTPSRYKYMVNQDHMHTAHRLTAIGTLARQFMGWKADELQATTAWFVQKGGVPEFGANGEKVDLYYWYYASLACYQQHKVQPELWKQWCDAMKKAVIDNQCLNGDDRGSWNPVGAYSSEWGRVGQTALNALCLEVWYRYEVLDKGIH